MPAGFGVYLLLNWKISAEPFAFLRSRKALFNISAAWPLGRSARQYHSSGLEEPGGSGDDWHARALFHRPGFDLRSSRVAEIAPGVRSVDDRQLAAGC